MQIIKNIKIKYFRSLYTVELKNCNSVNIISGRNDVGKSNVIKALNLFFNEIIDWDSDFDFYENLSNKRLEEVRQESIKGRQFISIKIEFLRPNNYLRSLPEKFSVERIWFRDSETYEQTTNIQSLKLPSTITTAQRSLSAFLNKIHFEYVPAIRDRNYTDILLNRLQRNLLDIQISQDKALSSTAASLASHIEDQIGDLKGDFETATKINTTITPPNSLSDLFQAFIVSTKTNNGNIPLKFRGDGLQSRYIASVLYYIAKNSNDFHIWGYEEPEIALEYGLIQKLAEDFCNSYSNKSQIFISTHSPAFISLRNENVGRYRVFREEDKSSIASIDPKSINSAHLSELKSELGILDIQNEVHELYMTRLQELESVKQAVTDLELEIKNKSCPLVITEGKTDRLILEIAKDKLDVKTELIFRESDNSQLAGGNGGASQLARIIETIHPDDNRFVIAIFDNDEEGKKQFDKLSANFQNSTMGLNLKAHINGYAWATLLPEPDFRKDYAENGCLCIEYLFKDHILDKPFGKGRKLERKTPELQVIINGKKTDLLNSQHINSDIDLSSFSRISGDKELFSREVVSNLNREDFLEFNSIFNIIDSILKKQ